MGNKKAREYLRKKELGEAWEKATEEPRDMHEDLHIPGIGAKRINIKYKPSLDNGFSWDVRYTNNLYNIYESSIESRENSLKLLGYEKLEIESDVLSSYFEEITSQSFKISPIYNDTGGIDGTAFELKLVGDLHSEVVFRWWSSWPKNWGNIIEPTFEMIELLLGSKVGRGECA